MKSKLKQYLSGKGISDIVEKYGVIINGITDLELNTETGVVTVKEKQGR